MFDTLSGCFADQGTVVTAHVIDHGFVETVAADTYGRRVDHAVQGDNCDFGSTAADINNHRTGRFRNRQACADRGRHRLFDQEDFTSASALRGFADSTTLNLGRANRHAHQHAWARTHKAVAMHLFNKVLQHLFSHEEVGDNAVFHRANRRDIARRTAQHLLRFMTYSGNAFRRTGTILTNGHNGRLIQYDALSFYINKGIRGTQVNGQVIGKHATKFF